MTSAPRPTIAIVGRFAETTSALRYRAVVNARALLEAVWEAGGEPITLLPNDEADWAERLAPFDGILVPGGGDIDPVRYGAGSRHASVYDVDAVQDGADLGSARAALELGMPLLAICRGLHIVNVVRGGTLVQDLPAHHRHLVHNVEFVTDAALFGLGDPLVSASCFHHQALDVLGTGVRVVARSTDGVPEAAVIDADGWAVGVQWHPEDTAHSDPQQAAIFGQLVERAREFRQARAGVV